MAKRRQRNARRRWVLKWGNPYTKAPDGRPTVIAEEFSDLSVHQPPTLYSFPEATPGTGYGVFHELEYLDPPRKMSEDAKRRRREQNVRRRIERAAPLFAEEFIVQELQRRP